MVKRGESKGVKAACTNRGIGRTGLCSEMEDQTNVTGCGFLSSNIGKGE